MTDDDLSRLAGLLSEADRAPDEGFVSDMAWLVELDIAFERRRQATLRRWAVDLGSALAIGGVVYVLAGQGPSTGTLPLLFMPLLAATVVPVLWLFARGGTANA
jgi:hypothetical protein